MQGSTDYTLPREGSAYFKCFEDSGLQQPMVPGFFTIRIQNLSLAGFANLGIRLVSSDPSADPLSFPANAIGALDPASPNTYIFQIDANSGWAPGHSLTCLTLYNTGRAGTSATMSGLVITISR
jgi:hypothetical protein